LRISIHLRTRGEHAVGRGQYWRVSFRADNERLERQRLERQADPGGDRECARGEWCSSAVRQRQEDGTTIRCPARGPRAFCDSDARIIEAALRAFPATWARLWPALLDHVTGEILVRIPFGPSVPVRCDVDEVMRAITDCAIAWHERVARVDPTLTPPDTQEQRARALGRHAQDVVRESARVLRERVSVLTGLQPEPMTRPVLVAAIGCGTPAADPGRGWGERVAAAAGLSRGSGGWDAAVAAATPRPAPGTVIVEAGGADAGSKVLRLDYLARAVMGETNPDLDKLLGVQCEGCGHRSLRRAAPPMHEGDQLYFAACDDCHAMFTDEEFRVWLSYLVRFYGRRVTPVMLASAGLRGDESPAIMAAVA